MKNPKAFLKTEREEAKYRPKEERVQDWKEIYKPFEAKKLNSQSERCMGCGVPFCQSDFGCPVQNQIPDWNHLVHQGRWKEALTLLHSTNNFPEFTGRLCPAPCESACVLDVNLNPVTIKSIEWAIVEKGFEEGWIHAQPIQKRSGKKVAIIGSGPAGLAAAQQLARKGHSVVVYEKASHPGGLLRFGIPDFKFEKWRVERRIQQLEAEGVEFKTGIEIGKDLSLSELRVQFDAIGLAMGAEEPRDLKIEGRNLKGIIFAMDYLREQNQMVSGILQGIHQGTPHETLHEAQQENHQGLHQRMTQGTLRYSAKDRKVIIIGGGDTGSDCFATALRQGAKEVLQFEIQDRPPTERSDLTPWPLWPLKLRTSHAHEEGGLRHWSIATESFEGDLQGHIKKLKARRLDLIKEAKASKNNTQTPTSAELNSLVEFETDLVILCMGFSGPRKEYLKDLPLEWNGPNLATDKNFMTSQKGIFVAGDMRRGASLIVWAIAEGRKMAEGIQQYLTKSGTMLRDKSFEVR